MELLTLEGWVVVYRINNQTFIITEENEVDARERELRIRHTFGVILLVGPAEELIRRITTEPQA